MFFAEVAANINNFYGIQLKNLKRAQLRKKKIQAKVNEAYLLGEN